MGEKLTIADLFVCHYRSVCQSPEFWEVSQLFFEGNEAADFGAYYTRMLDGEIGQYFATRYGSDNSPDKD